MRKKLIGNLQRKPREFLLKTDANSFDTCRSTETHASWKVLLPFSVKNPILAVGLKGSDLASLARSWPIVHVYKCDESELERAVKKGQNLGLKYKFEQKSNINSVSSRYAAIAVSAKLVKSCDPEIALMLLRPGGSVSWIGRSSDLPSESELIRKGFKSTSTYAFIPSSRSKILLPISDSKSARAGLNLHLPGTPCNRLAVRIGQLCAIIGCQSLLGQNRVVLAKKPGYLVDAVYLLAWLGESMGKLMKTGAIYTGSNRDLRFGKILIQLLNEQGQTIGIAKVADTILAAQAMARETKALKHLERVSELRNAVPTILTTGECQNHIVQMQTAVGSSLRFYRTKLTSDHLRFLTILSHVDVCEINVEQWSHWANIWRWAHEYEFGSIRETNSLRMALEHSYDNLQNTAIPFHRVHGDFAPWNILSCPHGLAVVDWEESEAVGLPFYDSIYFALQVATLLKNKSFSFEQLLFSGSSILAIDRELNVLASSLNLKRRHMESLVRLCLIQYQFKH